MATLQDFLEFAADAAARGWHERNGGNVSMRVEDDEVQTICAEYASAAFEDGRRASSGADDGPARATEEPPCADDAAAGACADIPLEEAQPALAGKHFLVTATGCFMRRVANDPCRLTGLIRLNGKGSGYRIVAGFAGGNRPTSEFSAHLGIHAARPDSAVVYHAHPVALVALSHRIEHRPEALTATLWSTFAECPIFTPEGIGLVPFFAPGTSELAQETARQCRRFHAVMWAYHGMLVHTDSLDEAYGLMETLEKAAHIALLSGNAPGIDCDGLMQIADRWSICFDGQMLGYLKAEAARKQEERP